MKKEEFKDLTDYLPVEKIASLFSFVLEAFDQKKIDKKEFLFIVGELTDRQTMTYELLNNTLRSRVDKTICKIWSTDSHADVDIITFIIINLGLEQSYEKAKESLKQNNLSSEIRMEIEDMIKEIGDNISNPLKGFF